MSNSDITLHGNLVDAPELRFTPSGTAVLNATMAINERKQDANGKWTDGEATFIKVIAWQQMAEAIAEANLGKGSPVLATGTLKVRSYETKEGEKRYSTEVTLSDFGISLKWLPKDKKPSRPQNVTGTTVNPVDYPDEVPFL